MESTEFFARQVKAYRKDRDWTQPQLADRCKAAGLDWDRSIVANVEGNRRSSIAVHEVFTLARVFDVPPALLLFPLKSGEPIELVKGEALQPGLALRWFNGEDDLAADTNSTYRHYASTVEVYGRLSRAFETVLGERGNIDAQVAVHGEGSPTAVAGRARYAEGLAGLRNLLQYMADLGVQPPPLPRWVFDDAARFGSPLPKLVPVEPEADDGER
ncbi:helix-turn-helix transcriptional regulator [Actinoplanes solisilvae]|uniref:helix-turn-helix transcriptional regulator n=1 Tax=Actinoplanes solisilvae TaxID=2486853 RepID=UPI0013E38FD9|nr:helix-turn-helix domain-containing protein [Actinoplanes solisilvae]